MEITDVDPDELDRPEWNSLQENYSKHDIGEAYFVGRMHQIGLHVEHWGIDMREHSDSLIFDDKMDLRLWEPLSGQESAPPTWPSDAPTVDDDITQWHRKHYGGKESYGTGFPTAEPAEVWKLRAVADVKTKTNEDWMCAFNVRHFAHYAEWSELYGVPVFVYFTMVDEEDETVGEENILVPITTDWDWEYVKENEKTMDWMDLQQATNEARIVDRVSRAPDGNPVLWVDDDEYRTFNWLLEQLRQ